MYANTKHNMQVLITIQLFKTTKLLGTIQFVATTYYRMYLKNNHLQLLYQQIPRQIMCFVIPRLQDTASCQTSCTTGLTTGCIV